MRAYMLLTVQYCCDPVQDGAPKVDPSNKLQIVWWVVLTFYDVKNSLVEHRNGTCDTGNTQGLCTENREDKGSHERGQQYFGDTILLGCLDKI